jgi:hypothetical protein
MMKGKNEMIKVGRDDNSAKYNANGMCKLTMTLFGI